MQIIVAVDKKWGIGKKNDLLFSLKEDMKYFREKTSGKTVVMGYNTLLSFPNSKPLKNRNNIVLCPPEVERDDLTVTHTLQELSQVLSTIPTEEIFIIGGAMFYKTMLPYCEYAYITKVDADGGAEVFFENLDELDNWELDLEGEEIVDGDYKIKFCRYKNNAVKEF